MTNPSKLTALTLALGLAVSPLAATAALAQAPTPPVQATPSAPAETTPPSAAPAAVDDAKLQSFVVAFLEVNKVGQEYQPRLEAAAGDQAEQSKIQEEASKKMVQAVENSGGITVQEYSSILTSAQSDPDLASQINEKIRQNVEPAGGQGAAPAQPAPAQ